MSAARLDDLRYQLNRLRQRIEAELPYSESCTRFSCECDSCSALRAIDDATGLMANLVRSATTQEEQEAA